jgi:hypothetical protein
MDFLSKLRIGTCLALAAVSPALFAQNSRPATSPIHITVLNARQIMERSVAAMERNCTASDHYTYMERDEDRRLDSRGQVKSEDAQVTKMALVNGARFEQVVEDNGHPPTAEEQRTNEEKLDKLEHETPEQRTIRLAKVQDNRTFLGDMLDAFDFELLGEETADARTAYVIQATPHAGYQGHDKYGKFLNRIEGKLWVDKENFGWIKVDGQVTQSFSMGLFVARVQRGSHVIVEETRVGDATWVPQRIEIRASARILFVKNLELDKVLTYFDYLSVPDQPYTASR